MLTHSRQFARSCYARPEPSVPSAAAPVRTSTRTAQRPWALCVPLVWLCPLVWPPSWSCPCSRSAQWLEEVVLDGCATLWGFTLTHPRLRRISLLGCNGLKEVVTPCCLRWHRVNAGVPHSVSHSWRNCCLCRALSWRDLCSVPAIHRPNNLRLSLTGSCGSATVSHLAG